jgi:hypothetical protein
MVGFAEASEPKQGCVKNKNAGLVGPAASLSLHLWGANGYIVVPADLLILKTAYVLLSGQLSSCAVCDHGPKRTCPNAAGPLT